MNKRIKNVEEHPEKRAEDNSLADAVSDKVFLGFSDTTINHFMLHKVCHKSFYGQSFISDICELSNEMLPCSGANLHQRKLGVLCQMRDC